MSKRITRRTVLAASAVPAVSTLAAMAAARAQPAPGEIGGPGVIKTDVVICGGGLSGMTAAWRLVLPLRSSLSSPGATGAARKRAKSAVLTPAHSAHGHRRGRPCATDMATAGVTVPGSGGDTAHWRWSVFMNGLGLGVTGQSAADDRGWGGEEMAIGREAIALGPRIAPILPRRERDPRGNGSWK